MEARRAQRIPDSDILLGSQREVIKMLEIVSHDISRMLWVYHLGDAVLANHDTEHLLADRTPHRSLCLSLSVLASLG